MTKKKTKRQRKKIKTKKTKKMKSRQQRQVVDPVTRAGLPPELVLPQLDVEPLLRQAVMMANALGRALVNRPLVLPVLPVRQDPKAAKDGTEASTKSRLSKD